MSGNDDADCYAVGSFVAAIVNFPLWRAGTMLLYGAKVEGQSQSVQLINAAIKPPYRAAFASIFGMTWSRGAVFYGCDRGHTYLRGQGMDVFFSSLIPAFVCSSAVHILNTPLIMGTLALQNPQSQENSVINYLSHTYQRSGFRGLFGGASVEGEDMKLLLKGPIAGVGAVALTSPFDSLHVEYMKAERKNSLFNIIKTNGFKILYRGMGSNMVAVTIPITITIFVSDLLKSLKYA